MSLVEKPTLLESQTFRLFQHVLCSLPEEVTESVWRKTKLTLDLPDVIH